MIFSLDAAIAFIVILFGCAGFTIFFGMNSEKTALALEETELEENAMLIADALVKNHNQQNPMLGACIANEFTKIVESNNISLEELRNAKQIDFNKFFIRQIHAKTKTLDENITISSEKAKECIAVKRIALIDGAKGVLEVSLCKKLGN